MTLGSAWIMGDIMNITDITIENKKVFTFIGLTPFTLVKNK